MTEQDRPVVWISHRDAECIACHDALLRGDFIVIDREKGIRCVSCEGLADLVFLPSGDVAVTRRALSRSARSAIVVKFSRARRRNERQGVLVEPTALAEAQAESERDAAARDVQKRKRQGRDVVKESDYVAHFAAKVREVFPRVPRREAAQIAARACEKHSGRVGRTAAAKAFDEEAIQLATRAHIRHVHTDYDRLLAKGLEPAEARAEVREAIEKMLARWSRA